MQRRLIKTTLAGVLVGAILTAGSGMSQAATSAPTASSPTNRLAQEPSIAGSLVSSGPGYVVVGETARLTMKQPTDLRQISVPGRTSALAPSHPAGADVRVRWVMTGTATTVGTLVAVPAGAKLTRARVYQAKCYVGRRGVSGYDIFSTLLHEFTVAMGWCTDANVPAGPYIPQIYYWWSGPYITQEVTHTVYAPAWENWTWVAFNDVGNLDPQWVGPGRGCIEIQREGNYVHSSWGSFITSHEYPWIHLSVCSNGSIYGSTGLGG